ncbi:MAG: glycosyltransferase family 2 protein, partial [Candidatus Thorarchaeota archaeon]
MEPTSFFEKYLPEENFFDRLEKTKEEAIDVIIPIFNTNPLFEKNLKSFYREIPINRLIIGDAGSTDDSINILSKFPRVKIINQASCKTLGYCIAELISEVKTEWFIYLHADVYLPNNWYDIMKRYKNTYEWFESDRRIITLLDFNLNIEKSKRAYSGSQMGRKDAFNNIITKIDDDYLYRNEDIIFQNMIESEGFQYGR